MDIVYYYLDTQKSIVMQVVNTYINIYIYMYVCWLHSKYII